MTKKWLLWVGIVLFLGGVASFIPNPIVGSAAFFQLGTLAAVVSIIVGAYFIYASYENADKHNKIFKTWGVVFVVVAIAGFLFGITLNIPDSWLALVVGVVFITLGEKTKPARLVVPAK